QEDVFLAVEVGEDRPGRDVRRLRDLSERGLAVAALREQPQRCTGDRLARLLLLAFAQARLRRRRVERAHLARAYQRTCMGGNFAMSVDIVLQRLYNCSACKLALHESRTRMLNIARWTMTHRRTVVVAWIVAAIGIFAMSNAVGKKTASS